MQTPNEFGDGNQGVWISSMTVGYAPPCRPLKACGYRNSIGGIAGFTFDNSGNRM